MKKLIKYIGLIFLWISLSLDACFWSRKRHAK